MLTEELKKTIQTAYSEFLKEKQLRARAGQRLMIAEIANTLSLGAADLEGVRLHDIRHTYASDLVNQGISLHIVGRLLGHTQPQTTARYAHLDDDALRKATNSFGSGLGEKFEVAEVIPIARD